MGIQKLSGEFIECCDCYTICPCWTNDKPDEDHCSAIYVWTFDKGTTIGGETLDGRSIVAASFHGNRGGSQSALYVDDTLSPKAQQALLGAFAGQGGPTLRDLSKLLGTIIDQGSAKITRTRNGEGWEVEVELEQGPLKYARLAYARGGPSIMDDGSKVLTIDHSALHKELRLMGPVKVQAVERFEMAVSPLPGGPFTYKGRAGMLAQFNYSGLGQ
jgi:hypothetical protein